MDIKELKNSKQLYNISKKLSLLFVEDDSDLRESTAELLEGLFKTVKVASDGENGLSVYETYFYENKEHFDIVISDIQMPGMDGITLSKEIYKINKKQKLLILSAYDDKKYFLELINMGISGFIQKPVGFDQLLSTLLQVCKEIIEEEGTFRYLNLGETHRWDSQLCLLYQKDEAIVLTLNETALLELLLKHKNKNFTSIDLFQYIYKDDLNKEYSVDAIKSLLKRLRKKLPKELISSTPQLGYSINI